MLKKEITYVNFNEEEVTRTEYFNYTKTELRALEHSIEGGFSTRLQNIAEEKNIGDLRADGPAGAQGLRCSLGGW